MYICRVIKNIKTDKMKTTKIETPRDLKKIARSAIASINGIYFSELYPMLTITNKHVSYYNVAEQGNTYLSAPFTVTLKD